MEEWKEVRLGDVCDLIAGYAFKASDFGTYPQKVIRIGDINPPFVNASDAIGVDTDKYDYNKLRKYIVSYGDFVLAMTGATIGKVGRYTEKFDSLLNQRVLLFKPKTEVFPSFIYYIVSSKIFQQYVINHIDSQSAQPNISANTLSKYVFKIPATKEKQSKVASILKSLDDKIENNRKINENLEQQAQALFKSWFVDFEPFRDQPFVESELGMIPDGWRVGNFGSLFEIKYGKDHKKLADGNYPVYGSGGLMRNANNYLYQGESVLIPRKGSLNNVMYVNESFWTVDTMFYTVPKFDNVVLFAFLFLRNRDLSSMNVGSAVPSMTTEILNNIKIVLPTNQVMKDFNTFVTSLYRVIKHNQAESHRLSHLRDTLLPKLMSGEIKL